MKAPAFQLDSGTTFCGGCRTTKPLADFGKDRSRAGGLTQRCRSCNNAATLAWQRANPEKRRAMASAYRAANRERIKANNRAYRQARPEQMRAKQLRQNYGLTPEAVAEMVAAQGARCALCSRQLPGKPHIDHCHKQGRVRALLCPQCNIGLGMFQDSPELLRRAAGYIELHRKAVA